MVLLWLRNKVGLFVIALDICWLVCYCWTCGEDWIQADSWRHLLGSLWTTTTEYLQTLFAKHFIVPHLPIKIGEIAQKTFKINSTNFIHIIVLIDNLTFYNNNSFCSICLIFNTIYKHAGLFQIDSILMTAIRIIHATLKIQIILYIICIICLLHSIDKPPFPMFGVFVLILCEAVLKQCKPI